MYNLYMKLIILGLIILIISIIIYFSNKGIREGNTTIRNVGLTTQPILDETKYSYIKINKANWEGEKNKLDYKLICNEEEIPFGDDNVMKTEWKEKQEIEDTNLVLRLPYTPTQNNCTFKKIKKDADGNPECSSYERVESGKWYCIGLDDKKNFKKLGVYDVDKSDGDTKCQKNDYPSKKSIPKFKNLHEMCNGDNINNLLIGNLKLKFWKENTYDELKKYIKWINKGGGTLIDGMGNILSEYNLQNPPSISLDEIKKLIQEKEDLIDNIPEDIPESDTRKCWEYNYYKLNASKRQLLREWTTPNINNPVWNQEICNEEIRTNEYQVFATRYGRRKKDKNNWGKFNSCCQFKHVDTNKYRGPIWQSNKIANMNRLYTKCNEAKTCVENGIDKTNDNMDVINTCIQKSPLGGYSKAAYYVGIKLGEGPDLGKKRKQRICENKVTEARTNNPEILGRDQDTKSWELRKFSSWGDMRNCCQFGIQGEKGYGPYKDDSITEEDAEKLVDACLVGKEGGEEPTGTDEEKGAWRVGKKLGLDMNEEKKKK